jgi:hypothetical protein
MFTDEFTDVIFPTKLIKFILLVNTNYSIFSNMV